MRSTFDSCSLSTIGSPKHSSVYFSPFGEVNIRQGSYRDADVGARELLAIYDNSCEPDMIVLDMSGLSSPLHMSPRLWRMRWAGGQMPWFGAGSTTPFEEEIFTCRVVYSFIGVVCYAPGEFERS